MKRQEILETAAQCVCADRQSQYGTPENSFLCIAHLWEGYLTAKNMPVSLAPKDVAAMMALLKIARVATGYGKADNWVDLAGYAACGGELESLETKLEWVLWSENPDHQPESDQTRDMPPAFVADCGRI